MGIVLCTKPAGPISAARGSDTLFPSDFGEDLFDIVSFATILPSMLMSPEISNDLPGILATLYAKFHADR